MAKRKLNDKEKIIISKNITFINENLEYDEAIAKQVDINIEVAPIIFQHQISEMKKKREGLAAEIEEFKNSLKILDDQLKNGVDEIETNEKKHK